MTSTTEALDGSFDAATYVGCDHRAVKAAALTDAADAFADQYHARFSGLEIAAMLRQTARDLEGEPAAAAVDLDETQDEEGDQ